MLCAELGYRPQQSSPVAERHAEFLEIAISEIGEHIEIDLVLSELFLVSTEVETTEPHADIHDRGLAPMNGSLIFLVNVGRKNETHA